jgi:hypothetical protein
MEKTGSRSRTAIVLAPLLLLLVPLVAMQFSNEVIWSPFDFVAAATLLVGTSLTYVLLTRRTASVAYRAASGIAVVAALLLVWMNLAVGIIGSEDDPANWMYVGALAIGAIGVLIARLQPRGMSRAMFAVAAALTMVAAVALLAGEQRDSSASVLQLLGLTGMFAALFVVSALLFRQAARQQLLENAAPHA